MTDDPRTLRRYADMFETPMRDSVGKLVVTSDACCAAAKALRFQADALERLTEY